MNNWSDWLLDDDHLYVGRCHPVLGSGEYGNPFKVGEFGRENAVKLFELNMPSFSKEQIERLRGSRTLGCWCSPDEPCHADVLLKI